MLISKTNRIKYYYNSIDLKLIGGNFLIFKTFWALANIDIFKHILNLFKLKPIASLNNFIYFSTFCLEGFIFVYSIDYFTKYITTKRVIEDIQKFDSDEFKTLTDKDTYKYIFSNLNTAIHSLLLLVYCTYKAPITSLFNKIIKTSQLSPSFFTDITSCSYFIFLITQSILIFNLSSAYWSHPLSHPDQIKTLFLDILNFHYECSILEKIILNKDDKEAVVQDLEKKAQVLNNNYNKIIIRDYSGDFPPSCTKKQLRVMHFFLSQLFQNYMYINNVDKCGNELKENLEAFKRSLKSAIDKTSYLDSAMTASQFKSIFSSLSNKYIQLVKDNKYPKEKLEFWYSTQTNRVPSFEKYFSSKIEYFKQVYSILETLESNIKFSRFP